MVMIIFGEKYARSINRMGGTSRGCRAERSSSVRRRHYTRSISPNEQRGERQASVTFQVDAVSFPLHPPAPVTRDLPLANLRRLAPGTKRGSEGR